MRVGVGVEREGGATGRQSHNHRVKVPCGRRRGRGGREGDNTKEGRNQGREEEEAGE